jgi:hypothetical protein
MNLSKSFLLLSSLSNTSFSFFMSRAVWVLVLFSTPESITRDHPKTGEKEDWWGESMR